jgi:hypothetical protein
MVIVEFFIYSTVGYEIRNSYIMHSHILACIRLYIPNLPAYIVNEYKRRCQVNIRQ